MIKSVGHAAQMNREYKQADDLVVKLCLSWLDKTEEEEDLVNDLKYAVAARRMCQNIIMPVLDINALLLDPRIQKHEKFQFSGMFVSALYDRSKERVINYDLDVPVDFLMYGVNKTFINKGTVGKHLCAGVQNIIYNHGTIGDDCAVNNNGVMLNFGKVGKNWYKYGRENVIINLGELDIQNGFYKNSGIILNLGRIKYMGRNRHGFASGKNTVMKHNCVIVRTQHSGKYGQRGISEREESESTSVFEHVNEYAQRIINCAPEELRKNTVKRTQKRFFSMLRQDE